MNANLISAKKCAMSDSSDWTRMASHSHNIRGGSRDIELIKRTAIEWTRKWNVGALGLGSPWEPISIQNYHKCEHELRDSYYAGEIPYESVMDRKIISGYIDELNKLSNGDTFFYIDNETPKNRFGHMWYVGFEYQVPAWHDYSQDHRVAFCDLDADEDHNAITGKPHFRRSYMEVVARQRKAGAIAVWAHPTSWWWYEGKFITNIAADLVPQLNADGYLDGMTVQGYDPYHRQYQNLWFSILDAGWHVPGFSELDLCFGNPRVMTDPAYLTYIPVPKKDRSMDKIKAALRNSRHFMTSGPFLTLTVDGEPTGSTIKSGAGVRHKAKVTAFPAPGQTTLAFVEILGKGQKRLAAAENFAGGVIEFEVSGDDEGGYIVARAFGEGDSPNVKRHQEVKHCAITNPVYLDAPQTPHPAAVKTQLSLVTNDDFGGRGGHFKLVTAAGDEIDSWTMTDNKLSLLVPASSRLEITKTDGTTRSIQLAIANRALRTHMDYLADGLFLKDYPECEPGDVPVKAFRLDAVRESMRQMTLFV